MQWIDDDPLLRDLPALIVAVMVHAAALQVLPALHWGAQAPAADKPIAVEVVSALPKAPEPPKPAVAIASVPAPKPKISAAPAPAVKARRRASARVARARRPVSHRMSAAGRALMAKRREEARHRAQVLAARRVAARHAHEELLRQARERALALAQQRQELRRERAAHAAALRAEQERLAQERRAEQERIAEERRQGALRRREEAARRAELAREQKARQRAELKAQLASLREPDEALRDAPNDEGGETAAGRDGERAQGVRPGRADLAAGGHADGDLPAPAYDMERDGFDPAPGAKGEASGLAWSIAGPIGTRRIVRRAVPQSPSWLAERGLEVSVRIRFEVLPTGQVKPGAVIERTSGFPDVDRRALQAIRRWRFEAAPGARRDAWGTVTFRFLMG